MQEPLVSACLIVRNEEHNLRRCLASVRELADEIVVHDTGSTDRTVEVARQHGARIDTEQWRDDFGYHRNRSLALARGRFSLVLDADEELVQTDVAVTREKLRDSELPDVLLVRVRLEYPGGKTGSFLAPRLLRTSAGIRYRGSLHEQLDVEDAPAALSNVSLHHHGYKDPAALLAKEERNLRIAESMEPTAHGLHCRARAAFSLGQWGKVVVAARRLLAEPGPVHIKVETCALGMAASVNLKDGGVLDELLAQGCALAPGNPDMLLAQVVSALGKYVHALRRQEGGIESLLRPPVFLHDAGRAESMLRLLLRGSGPCAGEDPE